MWVTADAFTLAFAHGLRIRIRNPKRLVSVSKDELVAHGFPSAVRFVEQGETSPQQPQTGFLEGQSST